MEITKETIISDILDINGDAAEVFMEYGMHCLGCACARGETIEEACAVHDINPDELVEALKKKLA